MRFEELLAFERKEAAQEAAQEAVAQTKKSNTIQNILDLLEDYREIPDALKKKLEQSDIEQLRKYHKLAARAGSRARRSSTP